MAQQMGTGISYSASGLPFSGQALTMSIWAFWPTLPAPQASDHAVVRIVDSVGTVFKGIKLRNDSLKFSFVELSGNFGDHGTLVNGSISIKLRMEFCQMVARHRKMQEKITTPSVSRYPKTRLSLLFGSGNSR